MENAYDKIAEQWHSNFRGQNYIDRVLRYVDQVLKGVPTGARVLDLGCGTGKPIALHMIEQGFQVTGIDQSEKMLEIARKEVPSADFIHADMINAQLPRGFAAAVAWDSIFHVERKYHSSIFQRLANSLVDEGRLLLSVGGSGDDGFTSEMYGHTFFYSGHEPAMARALLEEAGFEIELWELDEPYERGHIAVIARKVGQPVSGGSMQ